MGLREAFSMTRNCLSELLGGKAWLFVRCLFNGMGERGYFGGRDRRESLFEGYDYERLRNASTLQQLRDESAIPD